ncbi:uncharacterized protein LOC129589643 [Paramacrobiotus metropolitanus]|uniref:uncharacterized protein LOC129589643 n=1 Tax=Paramacrobiotus metropolitanus TaxID=2943436 RepID=UPI00244614C5|nr:uncharacterized protein LOC129589643 [Paramacrobiotus metropolitanus]
MASCGRSRGRSVRSLRQEVHINLTVLRNCKRSATEYIEDAMVKNTAARSSLAQARADDDEIEKALFARTTNTLRFRPEIEEFVKQTAAVQKEHFNEMRVKANNDFIEAKAELTMWVTTVTTAYRNTMGAADSLRALDVPAAEDLRIQLLAMYRRFMALAEKGRIRLVKQLGYDLRHVRLDELYIELVKVIQAKKRADAAANSIEH